MLLVGEIIVGIILMQILTRIGELVEFANKSVGTITRSPVAFLSGKVIFGTEKLEKLMTLDSRRLPLFLNMKVSLFPFVFRIFGIRVSIARIASEIALSVR